jgi:hypothetical protein
MVGINVTKVKSNCDENSLKGEFGFLEGGNLKICCELIIGVEFSTEFWSKFGELSCPIP